MIKGKLYENNSSSSQDVELFIDKDEYIIKSNQLILNRGNIKDIRVNSRIGNIQRKLTLNNRTFTTTENDLVDTLILKPLNKNSLLYKIESHFILILISIVITILVGFSFLKWGIPYSSKKLAFALPHELNQKISKDALKTLDKHFFKNSTLDNLTKEKIQKSYIHHVKPYIENINELKIRIHFRDIKIGKESIANAFALPDGNIILSDEFIRLSKNESEINSVIFHEIGHIDKKHGLQRIIEGAFLSIFIMYITGDGTAFSDFGVGLGSIFIDSHYSRKHELEADKYAFERMLKAGINPKYFSSILNRISKNEKDDIFSYFSSHPSNEDRTNISKKYIKCFENKKTDCN